MDDVVTAWVLSERAYDLMPLADGIYRHDDARNERRAIAREHRRERELVTLNDVLRIMRDRNMPNVVVRKTASGWENITAAQMYCLVSSVAAAAAGMGPAEGRPRGDHQ